MFNNSSHIDASHSTFSEVHRDQFYNARTTVQGNQTVNTIVHGNQVLQDSRSNLFETLQKASAPSATHDSAQRYPAPKCIEGTRVELLARLTSWVDAPDEKPICWLNGRPGSGKSAVSQTIAEKYASQRRLAASFFFSRRDLERRTTRHVPSTLITQLLGFLPSIRPAVIAALENDYMLPMKVLREQMEKLLFGPLSTATETLDGPFLIVIDALDECDDESLVSELITLLALLPSKTALALRLLITSRAEPWLESQFHRQEIWTLILPLETHAFSAEADIRLFLRRSLDDTYEEHLQVMREVPRPWPSPDDLERIVNKASGLFIFAFTVVKFVGGRTHNPAKRLHAILGDSTPVCDGSAYGDLDSLYRDAISVLPDADIARLVLGVIYCTATPLSVAGLHKLLALQRPDIDVRLIIPALSSVLLSSEDRKQPIQFYHASFRDFLTSPQRSRKYAINPDVYHRLMAQLCLEVMSNSLKRDMCGIGDPAKANNEIPDLAERRQAVFDESLVYACRFWSRHLVRLPSDGVGNEALLSGLERFSTTVLLCWIEALSLFSELKSAAVILREVIKWLKALSKVPKDVLTLLEDADRLVALYMEPISQCALHIYLSAISLFSTSSTHSLYKAFKHQSFSKITLHMEVAGSWNALRLNLNLHKAVHSLSFSPTGNFIATAGAEQGIHVWNVITGGNVASLGDPSSTSLLVRFSPSGAFLAAAFEGGTVIVWDPKVGREHLKHEGCHTEPITCLEFSNNSAFMASGSRDHTIQVWLVETAQPLYRLATHEGPVNSLLFFSDSKRLVSGSEDNLVIIWDLTTGKVIRRVIGHRGAVNCVSVSNNGSVLASGSEDKTIKIWDTTSGKCTQTFSKGHHSGIRSVQFFDEDKRIITACDNAVLLWNIASRSTSRTIWTAEQYIQKLLKLIPVRMISVIGWAPTSLIRSLLRLATTDMDIGRLTTAYATQSPSFVFAKVGCLFAGSLPLPAGDLPINASGNVTQAAISSDGNWAATADPQGLVEIYDLAMPRYTWEDLVASVQSNPLHSAFTCVPSPDGTRFIIRGFTQWSLVNENYHIIKKLDVGFMASLRGSENIRFKFSTDGSTFACVVSGLISSKNTLYVFDSVRGEDRAKFKKLKDAGSFVLSSRGAYVACGDESGQVDVFTVAAKERTSMGRSNNSKINVLLFSDDAQQLVGGSTEGMVYVWDRASGSCRATFGVSGTSVITALAYASTPGGARVGIGRKDGSVCLWCPSTSASHDILRSDQATVEDVDMIDFSDDQSRLRSRGKDGSVFTWAIPFEADDAHMVQCTLCPHEDQAADDGVSKPGSPPHLVSRSDPEDTLDRFLHTAYRVRKDGWLVNGDQRVLWFPPYLRPRQKDAFYAYEGGRAIFWIPSDELVFLKWEV